VLKTELHAHTRDDPHDHIPYSALQLIDRAANLGYGALAITLHERQLDIRDLVDYAAARDVVLIRGVERTISGKHVLLLNFGKEAEAVNSFEALAALKKSAPNGLVIAPHPFYPSRTCVGRLLDRYAELFDAVEFNAFYTSTVNVFNRTAVRWASAHGKPVVANADVHRLWQLGQTYSLVDAASSADAVCNAIRAGRVEICVAPLSLLRATTYLVDLLIDEGVNFR
jgi:predicted metal-dependent phosphoesterase TrpH